WMHIYISSNYFPTRRSSDLVKATAYILLTAYGDLYCDDYILPVGNLRESGSGADRAAIIIVTKCPENITETEIQKIKNKLQPKPFQKIFFRSEERRVGKECRSGSRRKHVKKR